MSAPLLYAEDDAKKEALNRARSLKAQVQIAKIRERLHNESQTDTADTPAVLQDLISELKTMSPELRKNFLRSQLDMMANALDQTIGEGPHRSQTELVELNPELQQTTLTFAELVSEMQKSEKALEPGLKKIRGKSRTRGILAVLKATGVGIGILLPIPLGISGSFLGMMVSGTFFLGATVKAALEMDKFIDKEKEILGDIHTQKILNELRTLARENPKLEKFFDMPELASGEMRECMLALAAPSKLTQPLLTTGKVEKP